MAFTHRAHVSQNVFSIMAGWIAEMLFMLFSLLILLCNEQIIAEYKVYWLMGVPLINS